MPKYFAAYKCQLCGAILKVGQSFESKYDDLPAICGKIVFNQQFINNPALRQAPTNVPHKCSDGSCGLAYFARLRLER